MKITDNKNISLIRVQMPASFDVLVDGENPIRDEWFQVNYAGTMPGDMEGLLFSLYGGLF